MTMWGLDDTCMSIVRRVRIYFPVDKTARRMFRDARNLSSDRRMRTQETADFAGSALGRGADMHLNFVVIA
jgi:hypothetical protein